MVHGIELSFDPDLDAAVRAEWAALAAAGLPSLASHTSPTNRPHVTLLAAPAVPVPRVLAVRLPFPVRLGAVACFPARPGEVVLVRIVAPTAELLSAHAAAHAAGVPDLLPHVEAGSWTPHVTLARRFPLARAGDAVALVGRGEHLTGAAVRADHWDGDAKVLTHLGTEA